MTDTRRRPWSRRRRGSVALAAVVLAAAVGVAGPVPVQAQRAQPDASDGSTAERVQATAAPRSGPVPVGVTSAPAVSADGRFVAFQSTATDLVPGDTNGHQDVFVFDTQERTTARVSVASDGREGDGPSGGAVPDIDPGAGTIGVDWERPSVSADGRFVAFSSTAGNLVDHRTEGRQVFVRDRDVRGTGVLDQPGNVATFLASPAAAGDCGEPECPVGGDGASRAPSLVSVSYVTLTATGFERRRTLAVAFSSTARNLVRSDPPEQRADEARPEQVFLYRVDRPEGEAATASPPPVPTWVARSPFAAGGVSVVSTAGGTARPGNGTSRSPALAAQLVQPDGELPAVRLAVAYSSVASDLVDDQAEPCERECRSSVHLWTDEPLRRGRPTTLVTRSADNRARPAGGSSTEPVLTGVATGVDADLRWDVAYTSTAEDLLSPGLDSNGRPDVYTSVMRVEHQPATETREERAQVRVDAARRVSVGPSGVQVDGPSGDPSMAPGGRFVAFSSEGRGAFVRDRDPDGSGVLDAGPGATSRLAPLVPDAADQPPAPIGTPALGASWDGGAYSAVVATAAEPGAPGQLLLRPWRDTFGPVTELPVRPPADGGKERPAAVVPPDPPASVSTSIAPGTNDLRTDWVPAATGEPATFYIVSHWTLPRVDDPFGVPIDLVQFTVQAPGLAHTWGAALPGKVYATSVSAANEFGVSPDTVGPAIVIPAEVAPRAIDVQLEPDEWIVREGASVTYTIAASLRTVDGPAPVTDVQLQAPAGCGPAVLDKRLEDGVTPDPTPDELNLFELWTWTCSATLVEGVEARAGVTGISAGGPAEGTAIEYVDVLVGGIDLVKRATPSVITPAFKGTVSWTITGTNRVRLSAAPRGREQPAADLYDVDLVRLTLADPLCSSTLSPDPSSTTGIGYGESHTWTCTSTGVTSRIVNDASMSAFPSNDGLLCVYGSNPEPSEACRITADTSAAVPVASIVVAKSVDKPVALKGSTVTWKMDVSIPADGAPVERVRPILDDQCPLGSFAGPVKNPPDDGDDVLEAGEVWTWTCASTVTVDTRNTVTFEAYPWKELAPECYEAPIIINRPQDRARPSAVGDPYPECRLEDADDADVDVIDPAVSLAKAPDRPVVVRGSTVTWSIDAVLVGDLTPVKDLVVTDPGCGPLSAVAGDDGDAVLEPGEAWRWTCQSAPVASYTNTATLVAADVLIDSPVTATAQAPVSVIQPGIVLAKVVDKPIVVAGTVVRWTMTASIAGDGTPVRDVDLTDAGCDSPLSGPTRSYGGAPDPTPATLDPGDAWVWTCTSTIAASTTNTATVTGADVRVGSAVSATATAEVKVVRPGIDLTKSVDRPVVVPGTVVTWTMAARLAGEQIPLDQVVLTDPRCDSPLSGPSRSGGDGDTLLEPGETWTWTCTTTITAETLNTATVTGRDVQAGSTVDDTAEARVRVTRPGVRLHKSAYWTGAPGGVLWSVEATVGGDGTALEDVVLVDVGCGTPLTGPDRRGGDQDDRLERGEEWVWLCTSVIDGYGENTATITAVDVAARSTVTDDAKAIVYAPRLALRRPMGQQGAPAFVTGTFFPPGTTVRLGWKPGIPQITSTVATGFGSIATPKMVFRHDPLGARLLLAVDFQAPVVLSSGDPYVLVLPVEPVAYVVQPLTFQPPQWVPDPADEVPGPPSAIERAIRSLRGNFLSLVARG